MGICKIQHLSHTVSIDPDLLGFWRYGRITGYRALLRKMNLIALTIHPHGDKRDCISLQKCRFMR